MSCHDGTIALDSFGGKTAAGAGMMTGGSKLGTDLTNDHPISITYDAALAVAKRDMISPVSASFVDAAKTVPLFAGKMECSTCHNSHDNANGSFLRKSNAGSALCLSCHKK
jgi:predicted CXXCH cytochrome family protein